MKRSKIIVAKIVIVFLLVLTILSDSHVYAIQPGDGDSGSISIQRTVSQDVYGDPLETVIQDVYGIPTPTPTSTPVPTFMNLDFEVKDSVCHPSKPIIYMTSYQDKKIYSLNYETGEISSITFDLAPEKLTFENNEIYVALIKSGHQYYTTAPEEGAVAIINPDTFQLVEQFNVNIDPFDIVADKNGYIYIVSGTNQWTNIKSFSRTSKQEIASGGIRMQSYAVMHPSMDRIYTIDTDTSPRDYETFTITSDAKFEGVHDSPYHGDYSFATNFRISPDGKYNFNGSGVILSCDSDSSKDLRFVFKLNKGFNDIAFDLANNRFYTAVKNSKLIYVYDYNTFIGTDTLQSKNNIKNMYYRDNALIALSITDDNKTVIEQISLSSTPLPTLMPTLTPTATFTLMPTPTPMPTMENGSIIIGNNVSKTAIDTEENVLYLIDSENNTLCAINYLTGERSDKKEFYKPTSLVYANNQLFVGFGDQGYIGIYDRKTLQITDQIFTGYNFGDIAVGNDGFIYTGPSASSSYDSRYVKSFSAISKQEISKFLADRGGGAFAVNPSENIIYIGNGSFTYENGKISANGSNYINNGSSLRNRVSPDGNYVFNASANIYTKDLKFYFKLNKEFNDVAFDIDSNRFYNAIEGKMIYCYDYSTLMGIDTIVTEGNVKDLYFSNNNLISVLQLDSGEYVIDTISVGPNVTPIPTPTSSGIVTPSPTPSQWNYSIKDSVFVTDKPYVYFIDSSKNTLASYNYETQALKSIQQYYSPNCIEILGEEILVGYGYQGMIGIYDSTSLEMKDKIMTGNTFTDFAIGRDGYIYLVGSGIIKSFSRVSKQELNSVNISYSNSTTGSIQMHSSQNIFYLSSASSSGMGMYQYDNGSIIYNYYYSGSTSSYQTGNTNRVSPDGYLVFNDKGGIFASSLSQKYDLRYITSLSEGGFSDLCINLENDRIYAASKVAPVVVIYKYSTFKVLGVINTDYISSSIILKDGNLISLSGKKVEVISEDSATIFPQVTPIPSPSPGVMLPEYAIITDVVSHPTKPYVYVVDPANGKVILTNTDTGDKKEVRVEGSPECVDYYNNEVYAGIGDQKKILILDADTLEYKDCIHTTFTFRNFKLGNDGYIYTSPGLDSWDEGYVVSYSRLSKQEISKSTWYYDTGYIVMNSVNNMIYFSTIGVSPSDINACNYENGKLISGYDSPYHGDYSMGTYNFVSSDGKYIINNTGNIFTSSEDKAKDLRYVTKLGTSGIKDIAFDVSRNRFYIVKGTDSVLVYSYSTFEPLTTLQLKGNAERIFYNDSKLMTLSKDKNGRYYYETVDVQQDTRPNDVIVPNNLVIRQLSKDSISVNWSNESPYICMLEYGTSSTLGSKTNWETSVATDHTFVLEGLNVNTKYYLSIHYKINDEEVQSDMLNFNTSDCANFDLGIQIDNMVYDPLNNKVYGFSQGNMKLFIVDLAKYEIEKTIVLDEKPSDMCLSTDCKTLYIINCYGTLSVIDLESQEKVEDISCTLPNWGDSYTHYHIYYNNSKLYLVDGAWAPGLWVYDLESRELKDYSATINGIGDLVFSSTGNEFYYWYQYGWSAGWGGSNIYKCQIDTSGNISVVKKLYAENSGYRDIDRDPLDTPIFLDEAENKLYCKNIVLDTNSFEILNVLSENVYAFAPGNKRFAGKTSLFRTSDLSVTNTMPRTNAKNIFFDKTGILYMCPSGDTRIFYYREEAELYSISIDGDLTITVPVLGTSFVKYNSVVKDQFDNEIESETVSWSVYNSDTGITNLSISDTGILQIDENTLPGNYIVSAEVTSDENIKASIQIVIKPKPDVLYGDVDGDGRVRINDAVLIRDYILGKISSLPSVNGTSTADVDGDGRVRINDAVLIRDYILGKILKFPVEDTE